MRIIAPPENILYEDNQARVVLSFDPISKAHVIIEPIDDYKDIDELPAEVLSKIMHLTQCYVKLLKYSYSPKGYSIMQNGGGFNDTGKFHLHIFQRNTKEEFSWTYSEEVEDGSTDYLSLQSDLKSDFQKIVNKQ